MMNATIEALAFGHGCPKMKCVRETVWKRSPARTPRPMRLRRRFTAKTVVRRQAMNVILELDPEDRKISDAGIVESSHG